MPWNESICISTMIGVCTGVCFAESWRLASASRHVAFSPYFTVDGALVGHDLVLVFAAMRRQLALRAPWASWPPCCLFIEIPVRQSIVYGIISYDSIETKRNCTWYDPILSVYSKLDAYMAYWYDCSAFSLFVWINRPMETSENLLWQCYCEESNQWNGNRGKQKIRRILSDIFQD